MSEHKSDNKQVTEIIRRSKLILVELRGNICVNLKGAAEMIVKVDALILVLPLAQD
jgi:hypothetical protein